jgi:thiamine transporter ThiT
VLLSYWLGGGGSVLIGLLMIFVFSLRRGMIQAHTVPLFAGLIVYFVSSGIAQCCRAVVLNQAGLAGGIVPFSMAQQVRAWCVVIRAVAAVWVCCATVEAIPFLRHYRSVYALLDEVERLRSSRGTTP